MAATNNPLDDPSAAHPTISTETHTIAGILTHVHGLAELPPSTSTVTCLWLLHPRLQTAQKMTPIAATILSTYNARIASHRSGVGTATPPGLIAVSFDQRNHGSRLVDALHNEAWNKGNPRHAQDMFGCIHGTVQDTSQLMDHLESYILSGRDDPRITQHFVLGISLGGHAAWQCVLGEPRITAAVVGIGCPDYARLMTDRARLSKLPSYTQSSPPGATFLGSKDFPRALVDAVAKYDPAGLLLSEKSGTDRTKALIRERLRGKRILNLSGKIDKLVPYSAGEPFLEVFKDAIRSVDDVEFEDVLFDGVGHAFPAAMVDKSADWISNLLLSADSSARGASKI